MKKIISFLILLVFFAVGSFASGSLSFAVTDGEKTEGVWTHTESNSDIFIQYVNSSRLGTTTVFIQGRMTSFEVSYRHSYYFEYVLPEDEQFELDTLDDFMIDPDNVGLTSGHSTIMKMRFYLDGTDEYVDIDSMALYNKNHLFENNFTSTQTVTKIRYWPVYDIYNSKGTLIDDVRITVSGVIASESLVSFRFLDVSESVNLLDMMPDTEFEYTTNSGVLKSYTGTGLIGGASKYSVPLTKERYETPIVSFKKDGDGYSASIDNYVSGAVYSYSVNGSEYTETSDGFLPILGPDDVICIKALRDTSFSQSLECIATPVVNAYSMSMVFDGGITFKVFLVSSIDSENFSVYLNGEIAKVEPREHGYYVLCHVAPKDLMDKVFNIKIVSDGFVVENSFTATDCIEKYSQYSDELQSLMSALKNYSKSAKDYFLGSSESEYADTENDEEIKSLPMVRLSEDIPEGISIYASSLVLEDKITIRHYFKLEADRTIDSYKFVCNNKTLKASENNGYYYVDIDNVSILSIADSYTLFVTSDNSSESGSVIYSVSAYLNEIINNSMNEDLRSLVRYLYQFYKASIEYSGI